MKRALAGSLCAFLVTQSAFAADDKTTGNIQTEASKTLERILKQAGDQGFLDIGDENEPASPEHNAKGNGAENPQAAAAPVMPDFDCLTGNTVNLWRYAEIENYDDVREAKSQLTDYQTPDDVMPVAQQFMALGLGTEAAATLNLFDTPEAKFLGALGQIIDGTSTSEDTALVTSYKSCGVQAEFWSRIAQTATSAEDTVDTEWRFRRVHIDMLSELPKHLSKVLTIQVGIYAAENGMPDLADQLFAMVEPSSNFGEVPKNRSDQRLYFFALVRQAKGDPNSSQVLNYLGRKDGEYQARALLKMVQADDHHNAMKSGDLHASLLSVQQQYKGNATSRKASLEIVRRQAEERQFIYAVDMTKKEFSPENAEYQSAVDSIGKTLSDDLVEESASVRLTALNGYLYDPKFFSAYSKAELLQYRAHKSAVDLNFPEIASHMTQTAALASDNAENLALDVVLANVKLASKAGDYEKVLELGLPHVKEPRFREILINAALQQGPDNASYQIASALSEGAEKLEFQAEIAGRRSDWKNAEAALSALEKLNEGEFDKAETLSIVKYVGATESAEKSIARLNSVKDVQTLQEDLGSDIDLVKAFLTDG